MIHRVAMAGLGCLRQLETVVGCDLDSVPFAILATSSQPLEWVEAKLAGSNTRQMNQGLPNCLLMAGVRKGAYTMGSW